MSGGETEADKNDDEVSDIPISDRLLAYAYASMQNSTKEKIAKCVIDLFSPKAVHEAKEKLWSKYGPVLGEKKNRKGSSAKSKPAFEFDDIWDALIALDDLGITPNIVIHALDIFTLPISRPEETISISVVDRLARLEAKVEALSTAMETKMQQPYSFADAASRGRYSASHRQNSDGSLPHRSAEAPKGAGNTRPVAGNTRPESSPVNVQESSPSERGEESDGFQLPNHASRRKRKREKRRRKIIEGTLPSSSVGFSGGPEYLRDIFISNVESTTPDDIIRKHLDERRIAYRHLEQVSHPAAKFKSYKLTVPASAQRAVLSPSLWSTGIQVQFFYSTKSSPDADTQPKEVASEVTGPSLEPSSTASEPL